MTRLPVGRIGLAVAAALIVETACVGGGAIRRAELPGAPLAVVYRTEDEGRQRADWLRRRRERPEHRPGIARFEDLERLVLGSASGDPVTRGRLALLDPRTGVVEPRSDVPKGSIPLAWTPDHGRLLLTAPVRGRHQLFALDFPSGELYPLTHGPERHPMGCLLPDDRLVAARATPRKQGVEVALWITGPEGGSPVPLTEGPADAFPACAPDGGAVAFVRGGRGRPERIAVLDLAAGRVREVATGTHPAYTPDGAWIVYSARTAVGARLWRVRRDGTGKIPIGQRWEKGADELTPAVSPDGRFVAYVLQQDDRDRLRLRRLDGRGDRPLLEFGDGAAPAW